MKPSMKGGPGVIAACLVAMRCGSSDNTAMEVSRLSVEDSVEIWVAVIRATLQEAESPPRSNRIWLPDALVERPSGVLREEAPAISSAIQERIRGALPGARFVEHGPSLSELVFECPPGGRVVMPGTGCPIRDDGVVVMIGPLWVDEGGVLRSLSAMVESRLLPDLEETDTWMRGFRIRMERSESGEWVVGRIDVSWVT